MAQVHTSKKNKLTITAQAAPDKDDMREKNSDYGGSPPSELAAVILFEHMSVGDIIMFLSAITDNHAAPEDAREATAQLILDSLASTGLILVRKEY